MGRLANISGKEAAAAFGKAGWQVEGASGKPFSDEQAGSAGQSFNSSTQGTGARDIATVEEFLELL